MDFKNEDQDMWLLRPPKKATTSRKKPTHDSDGDKITNPWDEEDENFSDSDDSIKEAKTRKKIEAGLCVIQPVSTEFKAALDYRKYRLANT